MKNIYFIITLLLSFNLNVRSSEISEKLDFSKLPREFEPENLEMIAEVFNEKCSKLETIEYKEDETDQYLKKLNEDRILLIKDTLTRLNEERLFSTKIYTLNKHLLIFASDAVIEALDLESSNFEFYTELRNLQFAHKYENTISKAQELDQSSYAVYSLAYKCFLLQTINFLKFSILDLIKLSAENYPQSEHSLSMEDLAKDKYHGDEEAMHNKARNRSPKKRLVETNRQFLTDFKAEKDKTERVKFHDSIDQKEKDRISFGTRAHIHRNQIKSAQLQTDLEKTHREQIEDEIGSFNETPYDRDKTPTQSSMKEEGKRSRKKVKLSDEITLGLDKQA